MDVHREAGYRVVRSIKYGLPVIYISINVSSLVSCDEAAVIYLSPILKSGERIGSFPFSTNVIGLNTSSNCVHHLLPVLNRTEAFGLPASLPRLGLYIEAVEIAH